MPAFITHSLFGEDVLNHIREEHPGFFAIKHHAAYEWGLQGPDLLFYNGTLSPFADRTLNQLGGVMHREKTEELWNAILDYLQDIRDGERFGNTMAYVLGFCCHYCLDYMAHPYLFCQQERLKRCLPESHHRGVHNRLESDLDTDIYRYKTGKSIRVFSLSKGLASDRRVKRDIASLYHALFRSVYGIETSIDELASCVDQADRVVRLLNRPGALPLAWALDHAAGLRNRLSAHIRRTTVAGDILNLRHGEWHHLARPQERRRESYPELERQAAERALSMIHGLWNCVENGEPPRWSQLPPFDNGAPA